MESVLGVNLTWIGEISIGDQTSLTRCQQPVKFYDGENHQMG
jgi:hypothetical protein